MEKSDYIIRGGQQGAERLAVLTEATWPYTKEFFRTIDLSGPLKMLDVGCGSGDMALRLADFYPNQLQYTGVDFDPAVVEIARQKLSGTGINAQFEVLDIEKSLPENGPYNLVYCRFLLSHQQHPEQIITRLRPLISANGYLAIEDVDFDGHFSFPANWAFKRYVELYEQSARSKGANPLIGTLLPEMAEKAGFKDVHMKIALPAYRHGAGKQMALLTMQAIAETVEKLNQCSSEEVAAIIQELKDFTEAHGTIMSLPRIFQVWAKA